MRPAENHEDGECEQPAGRFPWVWVGMVLVVVVVAAAVAEQFHTLRGTHRQTASIRGYDVGVSLAEVVSGKHLEYHRPWLLRWTHETPFLELFGFRNHLPVIHELKYDGVGVVLYGFASTSGVHTFQAEFSDGRGWKTMVGVADWTTLREKPVTHEVDLYAAGPVPRSSPQLQVRLLDFGGTTASEVARFAFANPLYNPVTPISPVAHAPVSAIDRDLSVTLQQLVTGVPHVGWDHARDRSDAALAKLDREYQASRFRKSAENEWASTAAEFRFQYRGRPSNDWAIVMARFQNPMGDEYGNQFSNQVNDLRIGEHYYYSILPMMWTGEGAFKLKLDLARTRNFAEDELLTVTAVVPAAGKPPAVNTVAFVSGTTVTFQGICGEKYTEAMPGGNWNVVYPNVFLVVEEPGKFHAMLASAVSTVTSQTMAMMPGDTYDYIAASAGPNRRREAFGLWSAPAGTTITLTFAVTPLRSVELAAEPKDVGKY